MRIAVSALMMLLTFNVFPQENLSLGQDLKAYMSRHPPKYKTAGPTIINIPEGAVDFYKYTPASGDKDLKILVILDKYPVGVLQSENGQPHLLYDLTGDGILDTEVSSLEVPFWVVAENTDPGLKTSHDDIVPYLDRYYGMFQADEDPYSSGKYLKLSEEVVQKLLSGSLENRDLFYALFCYYRWGNRYPAGAIASANYLAGSCFRRFHLDHPLFHLQFLESLINLGRSDQARTVLDGLLTIDPSFVPAQVYRWQLEKDPQKKKSLYDELKKQHPNHWIVRQI